MSNQPTITAAELAQMRATFALNQRALRAGFGCPADLDAYSDDSWDIPHTPSWMSQRGRLRVFMVASWRVLNVRRGISAEPRTPAEWVEASELALRQQEWLGLPLAARLGRRQWFQVELDRRRDARAA